MQVQRTARLFRALAARNGNKRNAHNHPQVTTYNDLPQPEGCWSTHNEAQQRKYNAHLVLGIGFTLFSFIVAKAGGFLYMNYDHPIEPAEKNDYVN